VHNGLTPDHLAELIAALSGQYRFQLCGGRIHAVVHELPGTAVASISTMPDGTLLVIYDLRKPDAMAHLRDLLRQWWTSTVEPVAYPDGSVELQSRALPRVDLLCVDVNLGAPA
jgi:hypothetical protein